MSDANLRERVLRHVNKNELPYQPRGLHHTRLEAFTDAVWAFAITLSVLSLEVPHDSHELLKLFRGTLSFGFSFIALFGLWVAQNRYFRRFGLEDDRTVWTTGAILFVILLYTYPMRFVAAWELDRLFGPPTVTMDAADKGLVFVAYGIGFGAISALFASQYRHALNLKDVLGLDEAELLDARQQMRQWLAGVWLGAAILTMELIRLPLASKGARIAVALVALVAVLGACAHLLWVTLGVQKEKKAYLAAMRAREAAAHGSPGATT